MGLAAFNGRLAGGEAYGEKEGEREPGHGPHHIAAGALPPNAPANTVLSQFWDTNNVWVPLNNNTVRRLPFNDNLAPWRNQYMAVPNQWFLDASLFKFTNITEKVTLRLNIDFFNVLSNPNNPTAVSSDGILSTRNSGSPARVAQLTVRLQF